MVTQNISVTVWIANLYQVCNLSHIFQTFESQSATMKYLGHMTAIKSSSLSSAPTISDNAILALASPSAKSSPSPSLTSLSFAMSSSFSLCSSFANASNHYLIMNSRKRETRFVLLSILTATLPVQVIGKVAGTLTSSSLTIAYFSTSTVPSWNEEADDFSYSSLYSS